jgi:hypothetical protein
MIVVVGIGTSISVNGISTICASSGKAGFIGVAGFIGAAGFVFVTASSCGGSSAVLIP